MRVPLSWLREFVEVAMSPEELAQRLTLSGLEVESVEYIGLPGAELVWERDTILVANILEVRPHPNADRLVLADIDYGGDAPHTVVTGAPNLFPYRGQGRLPHPLKGVFAREGAELYDGHAAGKVKMRLKGRPVRGIMSDAMLCSEKELGLSDDHEGVLILPDDAPVGAPLADYLGDVVLEIAITPNYARALSILGVAREVAALTGAPLRLPEVALRADGPPITGRARVTVEEPALCPRFTLTLIEGVTVGPSPFWMQRRLILAGMRPISNIVDVSNYVMLELGEPSHAFDADRVADQHLIVRLARPGERLTTLDGKEHIFGGPGAGGREPATDSAAAGSLDSEARTLLPLLVCDPAGPLGLAGVMGGASSEVSATTTRVLLEAAIWDPVTIRRTARALKLPSEASRRFERGVDWELPPLMQRRALSLLQQVAGGTVAQGMIDVYPQPWQPVELDLTPHEVRRILGIALSATEIAGLLRPLGFGCTVRDAETVHVAVPSFRQDVTMTADLCEEIARMYGYDRIPTTLPADVLPAQHENRPLALEQRTRDILAGAGLDEAITYSLLSMAAVARVDPAAADPAAHLKLANALTPEREYLRRSLLPTLLEALAANLRERERVLLFEVGRVYLRRAGAVLPDEPRRLAIAMAGRREPLSWLTREPEAMDFFDLKGVVETLLARLRIEGVRYAPLANDPRFQPGRAARLEHGDSAVLGVLGELHPDVRARLGIEAPRALAAELDLEALIALAQPVHYRPISRYPAASQDLAVVVPAEVPAARVAEAIRRHAGSDLEALTLFDVYTGEQIGAGKRSLTFRLTFRSQQRTLSDADLAKLRARIIRGLERDVGATLRG
jgi:phenylalanyl-tRNA synthetase beta chain